MATSRDNLFDKLSGSFWNAGVTFERTNPVPLEKYSVFKTYAEASAYALTNVVAYPGQLVAVINEVSTDMYFIDNSGALKPFATGGDATALEAKLNQEIIDRGAADTYISGKVDTISTDLYTLRDTTLPLSVTTLNQNLSVTVEKLDTPESGFESTYVVKQGGSQVGVNINIPKDKVISSAYMVNVLGNYEAGKTTTDDISSFTVTYAGESTDVEKASPTLSNTYWSIWNAYTGPEGGDGSYLRITVTNAEAVPIYVAVPELVDTYIGGNTNTISVNVQGQKGETRVICADVRVGSIGAEHLTTALSSHIAGIQTAVETEVTDRLTAVESARTDLSDYAEAMRDEAKSYTDTTVEGLDSVISAGTTADGAQKVFTKITQDDGKLTSIETALLQTSDINGLESAITQAESNAKTYTDGKLDALDFANVVGEKQIITHISQTDGKLSVVAKNLTLDDINNVYNDVTALISNDFDAKGAASTAESNAKAYTDTLSTTVDGKISSARTDLSAYARETSAYALSEAKSYTDSKITELSIADTYETKVDAAAKLTEAKTYTDTLSTAVDEKLATEKSERETAVSTARTDLSAYARETSAYALSEAKSYADTLSGKVDEKIASARTDLSDYARTLATSALTSANAYTNTVSGLLSTAVDVSITSAKTELKGTASDLSTAETIAGAKKYADVVSANVLAEAAADATSKANAAQVAGELSAQAVRDTYELCAVKYEDVKGGKTAITDTNKVVTENDIKALTGVMHFVGVTTSAEVPSLSTGWEGKPIPPYTEDGADPKQGDFVLQTDTSKEFVFNGTYGSSGYWVEVGDESLYAKQSALEAEIAARKANDTVISDAVDAEVLARKADTTYLSGQISSNLTAFENWKTTEYETNKSAVALSVANLCAEVQAEATARNTTDTAISTALDAKITVDGVHPADLSVEHISLDDYHAKVVAGTVLSNTIYIVSSDSLNMYEEKIINLAAGTVSSDAVNLGQLSGVSADLNTNIETAKTAINASITELSTYTHTLSVEINGVVTEFVDKKATFDISCIDCGAAE